MKKLRLSFRLLLVPAGLAGIALVVLSQLSEPGWIGVTARLALFGVVVLTALMVNALISTVVMLVYFSAGTLLIGLARLTTALPLMAWRALKRRERP